MKKHSGTVLQNGERVTFSTVLSSHYIRLAVPLMLQSVLVALVSATDSLMLGRLSQNALSAITLACQLTQIFQMFLGALCVGCTALQAQYFGNHDDDSVRRVTVTSLQFSLIGGLVFFLLSFALPGTVMRLFTDDPELIEAGIAYLRPVSFSYLFLSFSQVYLNVMKTVGRARLSAVFGSVAVVMNIVLNYLLIYGSFGFPALGVKGAAIATAVSRGAELLLVVLFVAVSPVMKDYRLSEFFRFHRGVIRKFIRYTVPTVIQSCSWIVANALLMAVIGHMGSDVVAASSVISILLNIFASCIYGMTSATGITLGGLLGAGETEKAKRTADILLRSSVLLGCFICVLLIAVGPFIFPFFNTLTDTAAGYLRFMLVVAGLKVIGKAFNSPLSSGIFSAGGDISYLMKLDIIMMWLVILPVTALAAFALRLPPLWVYLIANLDEFAKLYFMLARYRTYIWARNLIRKEWARPGRYERQIRRQIMEEMPMGVMVISNSGRVVLTNNACAELLGMDRESIEGGNYRSLFLTEEAGREALSDLFIEAMSDKTSPREADIFFPDERTGRRLHIRASYMEDEDCRIGLCVLISPKE